MCLLEIHVGMGGGLDIFKFSKKKKKNSNRPKQQQARMIHTITCTIVVKQTGAHADYSALYLHVFVNHV